MDHCLLAHSRLTLADRMCRVEEMLAHRKICLALHESHPSALDGRRRLMICCQPGADGDGEMSEGRLRSSSDAELFAASEEPPPPPLTRPPERFSDESPYAWLRGRRRGRSAHAAGASPSDDLVLLAALVIARLEQTTCTP